MEIKIKYLLPKGKAYEHFNVGGKINLTMDTDFDILLIKIDFEGYFNAFVQIWPKNIKICRTSSPLLSVDSGVDVTF